VKLAAISIALAAAGYSQGLDPAVLLKPASAMWPTYNGDYSGRRFSSLNQINESNISSLAVAWAFRTETVAVKSPPLMVNGILYFSVPDHVLRGAAVEMVFGAQAGRSGIGDMAEE
jgi:glucose dehydrogenase